MKISSISSGKSRIPTTMNALRGLTHRPNGITPCLWSGLSRASSTSSSSSSSTRSSSNTKQEQPIVTASEVRGVSHALLQHKGSLGQPTALSHPHLIRPQELVPGVEQSEICERRTLLMQHIRAYARNFGAEFNGHKSPNHMVSTSPASLHPLRDSSRVLARCWSCLQEVHEWEDPVRLSAELGLLLPDRLPGAGCCARPDDGRVADRSLRALHATQGSACRALGWATYRARNGRAAVRRQRSPSDRPAGPSARQAGRCPEAASLVRPEALRHALPNRGDEAAERKGAAALPAGLLVH